MPRSVSTSPHRAHGGRCGYTCSGMLQDDAGCRPEAWPVNPSPAELRAAMVQRYNALGATRPPSGGGARTGATPSLRAAGGSGSRLLGSGDSDPLENGLPISSASQPSIVATMLELLDPQPGDSVLEIGTGTGYNVALLAELVGPAGRVASVEIRRHRLRSDRAPGGRRPRRHRGGLRRAALGGYAAHLPTNASSWTAGASDPGAGGGATGPWWSPRPPALDPRDPQCVAFVKDDEGVSPLDGRAKAGSCPSKERW